MFINLQCLCAFVTQTQFLHFWAIRFVSRATNPHRTNTVSVFLDDIVVARSTNLCCPNSVSIFLGDKICCTGDNPCRPKTLFLCFGWRHAFVAHTDILCFWATSDVSHVTIFVARTQFLFFYAIGMSHEKY